MNIAINKIFGVVMIIFGLTLIGFMALRKAEIAFPHYLQDVCPFECCSYNLPWTALNDTELLKSDKDRAVTAKVSKGEKLKALRGFVKVIKPGVYLFHKPYILKSFKSADGKEFDEIKIGKGERVLVLSNLGENNFRASYDGKFYDFNIDEGELANLADESSPGDAYSFEKGQTEWWAQLQKSNGEIGWARQDTGNFTGADGCGGPAQ